MTRDWGLHFTSNMLHWPIHSCLSFDRTLSVLEGESGQELTHEGIFYFIMICVIIHLLPFSSTGLFIV